MKKYYFNNKERIIAYQYIDKKAKATVLMIHGAGSNLEQFEKHMTIFDEKFNVLNVTLYGHDESLNHQSFQNSDFAIHQLADDIICLVEHLKLNHIHIIGNSLGGLVGFEMIQSKRLSILSITTFGTAPRLMVAKCVVKLVSKIDAKMLKKKPLKYLSYLAKASSKNENTVAKMTEIMMKSKHAAPFVRSQIGRYDYLNTVENIKIPYLILMGSYDKGINKSIKPYINRLKSNPYIKVREINQSGHFMNMDQEILFNQAVIDFIS